MAFLSPSLYLPVSFSSGFLLTISFSVLLAIMFSWILLKLSPPSHTPNIVPPSSSVTPYTPSRKSRPPYLPPDTTVKPRTIVDLSTQASGRRTITNDVHEIPQIELEYFLDFVLPHADIGDFDKAAKAFKGALRTSFRKHPKDAKGTETKVFSALKAVFTQVTKAVGSNKRSQTHYHSSPSKAPSADAPSTSIPDICLIREGGTHRWEDIALTFEVKKNASKKDIGDNWTKIIWNMHQTLRTDPCRRFAFGITIENTEMQLWLMARGVVLASSRFDYFQKELEILHVLSSFLFASHTSLGWDPTIERMEKNCYSITHDGHKYVNCEIIHALGAELARGRCTRVFRGKDQFGDEYVIRDLWNDSDRKSEVEIMEDIGRRSCWTTEQKERFLHAIADVCVRIDDKLDTVLECVLHGKPVPRPSLFLRVSNLSEAGASRPQGSLHVTDDGKLRCRADDSGKSPYMPQYKKHERYVVRERGKAVDELDSFNDLFTALLGALSCLEVVFNAGYVHRDVSAGNILLVNGRGVLADFEYAKATDDKQKHDIRTGTEEFMALEVSLQEYRHLPDPLRLGNLPFRHNALHDLESLLWVAIWFAFSAEFVNELGDYERADENRNAQREAKKQLFESRENFFLKPGSLLRPFLGPAPLDSKAYDIVFDLVAFLIGLDKWYISMEKTGESIAEFKISKDQIEAVRDCFNRLLDMSRGLPLIKLGLGEVVKKQVKG